MKKASLFHKRNAALKSQYKNFPVLSYKNDLKTGQIFSSVQPVTRGVETFLFPVQQSGRSPDLQIIMHCPLPGCPVSFWHALPKYSDEFVQDSHLFPFSPDLAEALLKKYEDTKDNTEIFSEKQSECAAEVTPHYNNLCFPPNDVTLVTDPKNTLFAGYIQDYYCYYYPTDSSENKEPENILKGVLKLAADGNYCKAILTINTNTVNDNGNINYKKYSGYAAKSPTVNSLNCIMYSNSLCEFCFLMFRYFKLNFGKQDCRIAEVLSSSSATEDRRPTTLRMLLTRDPIKDSDLKIVAPALSLNYSTIAINRDNLIKIGGISDIYKRIVESLINSTPPIPVYLWKEDDIFNLAFEYLKKKEAALEFIMLLRADSYAYRYNKVGKKADDAVRNILLSKGYFKKRYK